MQELTQWTAVAAMAPALVLAMSAWGIVLWGEGHTRRRRAARPGAWLVTVVAGVIAIVALASWMVPMPVRVGALGLGLAGGALAAWYLLGRRR